MIIDCISDLHGHYPELEGGDILIIAGDHTEKDDFSGWKRFFHWLEEQDYREKIFVGGNHDNRLLNGVESGAFPNDYSFKYLFDSGTEIGYEYEQTKWGSRPSKRLKVWGSPWTKRFSGMNPQCMAFTVDIEAELYEKWELIPEDVDILITHSPPWGILDQEISSGYLCGSKTLRNKLDRITPKLHVFGHIHEQGGKYLLYKRPGFGIENNTICVNASYVNEEYEPVNKPIRIEICY